MERIVRPGDRRGRTISPNCVVPIPTDLKAGYGMVLQSHLALVNLVDYYYNLSTI